MRVLPVKRISLDTEQSSALERQGSALQLEALKLGAVIAGWVEDRTVSGSVHLTKRKSLGKWMEAPKVHEWDALMVTTQDRITRDDMHWHEFVGWCLQHGKNIIVLDDPTLDITTPNGRLIAGIKATQAANYLADIKKKRRDQMEYYREIDLWPGGTWPFGYSPITIQHNDKKRYRLAPDPVTAPLVREAYDRIVNKRHSRKSIAEDWNRRGILTAQDYQRYVNLQRDKDKASKKVRGCKWTVDALTTILTKPAIVGVAMHGNKPRLRDGLPVVWAEPILTVAEFEKLQECLEAESKGKGVGRPPTHLTGIVICRCGESYYSHPSKRALASGEYRVYNSHVCGTYMTKEKCPDAKNWDRAILQDLISDSFLHNAGDIEITTKTYIAGHDRRAEIKQLQEAVNNLIGNLAVFPAGSPVAKKVSEQINEYTAKIEEFEKEPIVASRWEEKGTGKTYGDWWNTHLDWQERAEFLKDLGFRMIVGGSPKNPNISIFWPEELERRMSDVVSKTVEAGYEVETTKAVKAIAREKTPAKV